ncbi:hypothetical protein [Pseudomonas gingeri]|uniref:hypothetical protein n=1 Tax=Pseudomonas gingeri TaxID=117681 RepID=UPI001FEC5991|nr:hypothetical protein [Pseudomonas gingeri]
MDIKLYETDEKLVDYYCQKNISPDYEDIQGHVTQSYLWVLGAYEVVRTLTQRMSENQCNDPSQVFENFRQVKTRFARVRVPLAKFEPASIHKKTDSHIAYPGFSFNLGIAWQVSEGVIVSRRELSDALLNALEHARVENLRKSPS